MEMTKKRKSTINVKGSEVSIYTENDLDFISLTDMVKNFDGGSALIEQWLKNKDTVLFLAVWEQLNNSSFNPPEFEGIKNEAGRNSFYLSAKKWIQKTKAIGLRASAGRYGGTYAHKDIAFEFGSWLSLPQNERLLKLNRIAIAQLQSLIGNKDVKKLNTPKKKN